MSIRLCSDFFVGRARAVARVRRAVVVLLAGLLTVWLLPTQAWAAAPSDGSATADSADAAEAYEHYLRAYKLASASAYEEALKELQQALEKGAPKEGPKHYPDYLFATAKVYGRLNRHIEAVAYYERYLQLSSPDAPNRAKAESELQGERAKLAPLAGEPLFPPTLSTSVAALPSARAARNPPFRVFPNPATDVLQLRSTSDINGRVAIITDLAGQQVARATLRNGAIAVGHLTSGTYLVHVITNAGMLNGRFVKQ